MSKYSAMTTNERLAEAGVFFAFEQAARAGDRDEMVRLLELVDYETPAAEGIADKILSHPACYGLKD